MRRSETVCKLFLPLPYKKGGDRVCGLRLQ